MTFNLNIEKAIREIKKTKPKSILVQLPDGLKPRATEIVDELKNHTKAKIFIWADSCFGACDYPELKDIDLLIQFGHCKFPLKH